MLYFNHWPWGLLYDFIIHLSSVNSPWALMYTCSTRSPGELQKLQTEWKSLHLSQLKYETVIELSSEAWPMTRPVLYATSEGEINNRNPWKLPVPAPGESDGTIEALQVIQSNEKPSQGILHNKDYGYELNIFKWFLRVILRKPHLLDRWCYFRNILQLMTGRMTI